MVGDTATLQEPVTVFFIVFNTLGILDPLRTCLNYLDFVITAIKIFVHFVFLKMASFNETLHSMSFDETLNPTSFNETQQMYSGVSTSLLIFKGITLSVLTFLSIAVNSLTLLVLHKCHEINIVTKVFLTSMTVADLSAVFLCLSTIIPAVAVDRWPFGTTFCSITGFLNMGLLTRSILSLLSVTFDRFLAVTRPYQYPTLMTVKRARIIVLGIWLLDATAVAFEYFVKGRSFEYNPHWHLCLLLSKNKIRGGILVLTLCSVPFLLIVMMFIHLFLLARFHAARIAAQERAVGEISDNKAFTTFFIITVCLFVQYIPFLTVYYAVTTREGVYLWLACFAQLLAYSSSISNVVIYYFRNTIFKQVAKRVIRLNIPCLGTPVIPLNV